MEMELKEEIAVETLNVEETVADVVDSTIEGVTEEAVDNNDEPLPDYTDELEVADPLSYIQSEEGKKSTDIVRQMNSVFVKQIDGMRKTIDDINTKIDEMAVQIDKKEEEINKLKDSEPENAEGLDKLNKELAAMRDAYGKNKEVANYFKASLDNLESVAVRRDTLVEITALLKDIILEVKEYDGDMNHRVYIGEILRNKDLTAEDYTKISEALSNMIRSKVNSVFRRVNKIVANNSISDRVIADIPNVIANKTLAGLPEEFTEYRSMIYVAYAIPLLLVIDPIAYTCEAEGTPRLTPNLKYQANILQLIDVLSIPSMDDFRMLFMLDVTGVMEYMYENTDIKVFKDMVDFIIKKNVWLKENEPEKYAEKEKVVAEYDAFVNKLKEKADTYKTDIDEELEAEEKKDVEVPEPQVDATEEVIEAPVIEEPVDPTLTDPSVISDADDLIIHE